jgi:cation:H+ antiporter
VVLDIVLFTIGLLVIYFGAEHLVRGSSALASALGLSPMVIGLTVVAFGTSAPEIVVSVVSSLKGKSMIAVGNVIGSNICNIALVLGLSALFRPISGQSTVVRRDIPIMMLVSGYLMVISADSVIGRFEGTTLMAGIVFYTLLNYHFARSDLKRIMGKSAAGQRKQPAAKRKIEPGNVARVVGGIAGVVIGAELLIDSAVRIMTVFGVSEKFIGLTMVAFGTSLPELATSVVAAWKKEMDISLGNLVGSNVFNVLCVLGAASLVRPIVIPGGFVESGLIVDYLVMMAISFMPWLMMRTRYRIARGHGLFLLSCYAAYFAYLVVKS